MRIFEIVKENVNLREAAELYGIDVNRYSKALCPFHNDRHPSLYVADDHYYCFACGEHGDVIDFVGRLFQLSPYDAVRKLMADFHLSPDKPPSVAALHTKRIRTEAQQLMENERLCFLFCPIIRPAQVKAAEQQLADTMHEKPSLIMLLSAKQETSRLLGEDTEERQMRQLIMHRNQEQYRNSLSKRKRNDPER